MPPMTPARQRRTTAAPKPGTSRAARALGSTALALGSTALALVRPTARAMPWTSFLVAAGFGLALVTGPAVSHEALPHTDLANLLRAAAVCAGLGVAFLLDDPATNTTSTVATPR